MNTFVVLVEDHPGVLTHVSGLIRRRGFNIDSITVGHTETTGVSRMTIAVEADEFGARRIEANLYKLIEVLRVDNVTRQPSIFRELAISYLDRTDLAHVKPAGESFDELGRGDAEFFDIDPAHT